MTKLSLLIILLCSFGWLSATKKVQESSVQAKVREFGLALEAEIDRYTSQLDEMKQSSTRKPAVPLLLETSSATQLPPATLGLLARVSRKEVAQIVQKHSSMTRRQRNCLQVREFLEVFPSTPSYYSSFWRFNWNPFAAKDPHQEMKSYRTLAYNVLTAVAHADDSAAEEVTRKVDELRQMKVLYFREYYSANPREAEQKSADRRAGLAHIESLRTRIDQVKAKMAALESQIEDGYAQLRQFADQGSAQRARLENIMHEVDRLSETKAKIELASTEAEVVQLSLHLQNKQYYDELRVQLRLAHDYAQLAESLETLAGAGGVPAPTVKMLREQLAKLGADRVQLDKRIANKKQALTAVFEKSLKKTEAKLEADSDYASYRELVRAVIAHKKELNHLKTELTNTTIEAQRKALELEAFRVEDYSDFVVPPRELFELKAKLEQLKQILTFDGSEPRKTFAPRKSGPDSPEDPFRETLRQVQSHVESSFQQSIYAAIESTARQLFLAAKIEDHEKALDERLGAVFAEVFELEGGARCFSLSQASYLFFQLFKTNTVANQHRFLIRFLGSLRFEAAQEFALYNLALFSDRDYVQAFESTFSPRGALPVARLEREKEYVAQFAVNYLSVVDFYKDLTEFREPPRALEQGSVFLKVWRSVGIDLGRALLSDLGEFAVESIVKSVVERTVKLVPFLSSVPFLDFATSFVVWKVVKFLTQQFMQLFARFGSIVSAKMTSVLEALQNKDVGLDFHKAIQDQVDPEPPAPTVRLSFQNLDSVYHQAYTASAGLFQVALENSRFFRPGSSGTSAEAFESSLDYFNRFVLGELVLQRFFEAGVPVHVQHKGVDYDLSQVRDYSLKSRLFGEVCSALSESPSWKHYFFDLYHAESETAEQSRYLARI